MPLLLVQRYVAVGLFLALLIACVCLVAVDGTGSASDHNRKCTDADAIDHAETRELNDNLSKLTHGSTFFSIFSVALDKKCPFWADNNMCAIRECSVCGCDDNEVPPAWRRDSAAAKEACPTKKPLDKLHGVDRSLPSFLARGKRQRWQRDAQNLAWTVQDSESETHFVDLRKNPEQYTGYTGTHANSIWSAVYNENCFQYATKCKSGGCEADACKSERVLYRLISGVHTSITAHLGKRYLFKNGTWGENRDVYMARIANDPERAKNLNVAFALVARAVAKASSCLKPEKYKYVTGDDENDAFTRAELANVLKSPLLQADCKKPTFDESDMFVESSRHRLPEFREKFRNISKIMDCVGCEKCRLWGKLQFLGVGTALRILFDKKVPKLHRNEVIALVNLLQQLSSSTLWVDKMERQTSASATERSRSVATVVMAVFGAFALYGVVLASSGSNHLSRREASKIASRNGSSAKGAFANEECTGEELHSPVSNGVSSDETKSLPKKKKLRQPKKRARRTAASETEVN